jgi:hypothetical protein
VNENACALAAITTADDHQAQRLRPARSSERIPASEWTQGPASSELLSSVSWLSPHSDFFLRSSAHLGNGLFSGYSRDTCLSRARHNEEDCMGRAQVETRGATNALRTCALPIQCIELNRGGGLVMGILINSFAWSGKLCLRCAQSLLVQIQNLPRLVVGQAHLASHATAACLPLLSVGKEPDLLTKYQR